MTKPSTPSSPPNPAHGRRPPESGWAIPEPGDVLSYAYLWSHEAEAGQEEGLKDRPVVVVIARIETKGQTEVNRFNWPGPDIRVVHTGPSGRGGDPYYGAVPDGLFVQMRDAIGSKAKADRLRVTKRSE